MPKCGDQSGKDQWLPAPQSHVVNQFVPHIRILLLSVLGFISISYLYPLSVCISFYFYFTLVFSFYFCIVFYFYLTLVFSLSFCIVFYLYFTIVFISFSIEFYLDFQKVQSLIYTYRLQLKITLLLCK